MSNALADCFWHYADDLKSKSVKQAVDKIATTSAIAFGRELKTMVGNPSLKLTLKQAQALQRTISAGAGVIERKKDGVSITLKLRADAGKDPSGVIYWAKKLSIGGKIAPKNSAGYLAIPFSKGDFKIVSFATGLSEKSIVGRFIESEVVKNKDGRPLLRNKENASGSLIMSGRIIGSGWGWEPIATLIKEVKVPETRWANTFLYNVVRTLTETI